MSVRCDDGAKPAAGAHIEPAPSPAPDAAPAQAPKPTCKAGKAECCKPDGKIVKATCWALDNGPKRGKGGWCTDCDVRCLPAAARIATVDGERAISSLRASAGHTTADGRRLDSVAAGALLDGARVLAIDAVPLSGDATWDLLPAGPTGAYWADGVLLGSTLAPDAVTCGGPARARAAP